MTNQNEVTSVELVQTPQQTALFLITKAEIDTQIATAKAFPRSVTESMRRAETMATISEEIAASCTYALPRAGKTIEGPSVRLAEIIVNTWGNIRAGARVIDNDGKTITAQGICHDLENNTCFTVEVKKKITDRNGKLYSEDMIVTTGQAACAIAFRNAVLKVVPVALIDSIWDKTKEVAKGKAETMVARRTKAVDYAKTLGITEDQICEKLEVKKIEDIGLDSLATFRAILTGIKNGETTVQEAFGKPEPETSTDPKRDRVEKLIRAAKSLDELNKHRKAAGENNLLELFSERETELTPQEA